MRGRTGQITIFVILLSLLALTVVLSLVSRVLSDLKQAAFVESGVRAYAAAEAGLRDTLYLYKIGSLSPGSCTTPANTGLSFPGVSSVVYRACSNTKDYVSIPNLASNDVMDVDLTGLASNTKGFYLVWNNNNASVEVEMLGPDYTLRRFIWAGRALGSNSSNFYPAITATNGGCVGAGTYCATADTSYVGGSCTYDANNSDPNSDPTVSQPNNTILLYGPGNLKAKTLRVKALQGSTNVAVCSFNSGNSHSSLQLQYTDITVTATATNNVVKRVQATLFPATMPAIFDNAIFSGGDLIK